MYRSRSMAPSYPALFAEYAPRAERRESPEDLVVREAGPADAGEIARIVHARDGGDLETTRARIAGDLTVPERTRLFVARVAGSIVGFGRVKHLAGEHPGWYLLGVIVDPSWRRRGIGRELVRRRLDWIASRAAEAWYFVNSVNRASIDLHAGFGFEEVARGVTFPGVSFGQGGHGVLFRVPLEVSQP